MSLLIFWRFLAPQVWMGTRGWKRWLRSPGRNMSFCQGHSNLRRINWTVDWRRSVDQWEKSRWAVDFNGSPIEKWNLGMIITIYHISRAKTMNCCFKFLLCPFWLVSRSRVLLKHTKIICMKNLSTPASKKHQTMTNTPRLFACPKNYHLQLTHLQFFAGWKFVLQIFRPLSAFDKLSAVFKTEPEAVPGVWVKSLGFGWVDQNMIRW